MRGRGALGRRPRPAVISPQRVSPRAAIGRRLRGTCRARDETPSRTSCTAHRSRHRATKGAPATIQPGVPDHSTTKSKESEPSAVPPRAPAYRSAGSPQAVARISPLSRHRRRPSDPAVDPLFLARRLRRQTWGRAVSPGRCLPSCWRSSASTTLAPACSVASAPKRRHALLARRGSRGRR